jgi:ribosome-associated protein
MSATGPLRVSRSVVIPEGELRWKFSHASGPGGQGVNTADTRVELRVDVARCAGLGPVQRARALERLGPRLVDGVLTVRASSQRSQLQNRETARDRLAAILAAAEAASDSALEGFEGAKARRQTQTRRDQEAAPAGRGLGCLFLIEHGFEQRPHVGGPRLGARLFAGSQRVVLRDLEALGGRGDLEAVIFELALDRLGGRARE